jgi:hypothetical protein
MVGVFACVLLKTRLYLRARGLTVRRQMFRTPLHQRQMHVANDLRTFHARETPKRSTTSSRPPPMAVAIELPLSKATEIIQIVTKCDSPRTSNH